MVAKESDDDGDGTALFHGMQAVVEFSYTTPYKRKQEVRKSVTNNGGIISYTLTKQVNL